jgi:large subunit ribosomal protein L6
MSRLAKKPIVIPEGVTVSLGSSELTVRGPKGVLSLDVSDDVTVHISDTSLEIRPVLGKKSNRAYWGTVWSLVSNLVKGVTEGFQKKLLLVGVGYRVALTKDVHGESVLKLSLGLSHDVYFPVPASISANCPSQTEILLSGIDKQVLGAVAAQICLLRPVEPYKGKGIHAEGDFIFRKTAKKK